MGQIVVSELYIYPVKSLAGIALQEATLEQTGFHYDRRWMVVTADGQFLTQRTHPHMALVKTSLADQTLRLSKVGFDDCLVAPETTQTKHFSVTVWNDTVEANHVSDQVDEWLSEAIGESCHLVCFPNDVQRQVSHVNARSDDVTAFSDGFPLLLISQGSLDDLNSRLDETIPMQRFRPNIVVTGCEPFAEDDWQLIDIAGIGMRITKPCSRCAMTTVDPETGQYTGKEPLRTLSTYRRQGNKVMFGQNVLHDQPGRIGVGDQLRLVTSQQ
ncbi:MAG: MOSC domain-containing protein [Gammaproteobacteria bacterium]|nr:MOSC domain-containing protein [Gammaproteobacteria bacterium]